MTDARQALERTFDDPRWWRGLTLAERLPPPAFARGAASPRAQQRAQRWQRQFRCNLDEFATRHRLADRTSTLLALFDETEGELRNRSGIEPAWRNHWRQTLASVAHERSSSPLRWIRPQPFV